MIFNSIYETIGKTPMIKLSNIVDENMAEILVKLESFNPGGSVKDRVSLKMIEAAEKSGFLKKGGAIIEPTSGNTGLGIAMIGASKGYRVILVMPETMSVERRRLARAYGAEIILTEGTKGMKGAVEMAQKLVKENGYFMPQQFENSNNPAAHMESTAIEILEDTEGIIDAFVAGIGTGGTITGVSKILKEKIKSVEIIGVEPKDSPVISGGAPGSHKIQGIGAGFIPEILDVSLIDEIVKVSNEDAFNTSRELARMEGILAGISSGAAVYAALQKARELGKGKRVVVIAPDTGERYLSTELFNME